MGKILALDIGTKRIGYAVSDEAHKIAFPREIFARKSDEKTVAHIEHLVRDEGINTIVIGLPLNVDNDDTLFSLSIRDFAKSLSRRIMIPVIFIDEFGSSMEALQKIPLRRDRRAKGGCDPIAAQIILQQYLDTQNVKDYTPPQET